MNTGDDAIAIQGSYYLVVDVDPASKSMTVAIAGGTYAFWCAPPDSPRVSRSNIKLETYALHDAP